MGRLILLLAVLVQAGILTRDYLLPWGSEIWTLRDRPPWERSARLSVWLGPEDVEFLQFLRERTPVDAELVFFERSGLYSWTSLLQYLLFPRQISVCGLSVDPGCLGAAISSGKFLIAVHGRPGAEQLPSDWRQVPFESGWGFYGP